LAIGTIGGIGSIGLLFPLPIMAIMVSALDGSRTAQLLPML
jgi:hypothetical protein